ncbi:MAG TPA: GxxExxY protein [Candidatus Angelobacter sp.]|jgi:GxxExxY protein|nr:GxxExxY protein [Candidatus Angelobacter sp.]
MTSPQMNADERRYKYSELTEQIIGVFYEVYNELGFGFLEKVYEEAMALALKERSINFQRQVPIPVWFHVQTIGAYDADLVVNGVVLLELKACRALDPAHEAQLLHYLRSTEIEVGLLLNFGPRPQVKRLAFENERKKISVHLRKSAAK